VLGYQAFQDSGRPIVSLVTRPGRKRRDCPVRSITGCSVMSSQRDAVTFGVCAGAIGIGTVTGGPILTPITRVEVTIEPMPAGTTGSESTQAR
jgi:hypothetical protein